MLSSGSKILLIGGGIWYLGEGMFGPLLALFTQEIGGSILDISWAWSVYLLVYGLLSIWFGYMADRFRKEWLMLGGYALNAIFTFGYLLVDDQYSLLFVQAGLGISAALATPTWNALFGQYAQGEINGYAWGLSGGVANIITAVAILIGGLIVNYYSFTTLFIVMGTIQVFATIYQAKILYCKSPVSNLN